MPHIVCAGLITVDFTFEIPGYPVEGTKMRAEGARMVAGGGALIAASAVAALGGQASLAGAVGDDALGAFLRDTFAARGIGDELVQVVPGVGTAHSAVLISAGGERTIINHRDAALFPEVLTLAGPFGFDAALADTRWPAGAAALLHGARAAGKPAVLDAEAPVRLAQEALHLASHIVFSQQGLRDYAGADDAATLAAVAQETGAFVAVTRGAAPVLCHEGGATFEVATFPARAVDTLGAGDVWHGAFTLALARGQAARDAVRHANAAAAAKVALPAGVLPGPDDLIAMA
ncbi:PfkB family carbohydrate kinase [Oceaniglobus trochenteri]|uniref:PfkB family carbohydrate kinase n=1 Tax=Oceaniglobus trochenteri TaxID=2763260 RepID=UPI001CFFDE36|nr:PfkB family carbohydrate kinase [Oceaniglobus trochenteri]